LSNSTKFCKVRKDSEKRAGNKVGALLLLLFLASVLNR